MCGNVKVIKGKRPLTKLQREAIALRPKLDKCWRSKIRPARELFTIHGWYHRKRQMVWCEACGKAHHQEFPEMGVQICLNQDEYICPHCGAHLIVNETATWSKLPHWSALQFAYVTNIEGWTVVRVFYVERRAQMDQRPQFDVHEVWQRWLNEKGREVILTKTYNRSPFHFSWKLDSDWKVGKHNGRCSGYYVSNDVYDLYGVDLGEINVAPILKRNGWRNELSKLRVDMFQMWQYLLKEPIAEELVKTGQEQVLQHWLRNECSTSVKKWIHAVRICVRNHYKISVPSMWFDHMELLEHFGKDTHSPKYVCPVDLQKDHTRLVKRKQIEEKREELAKQIASIRKAEPKYEKSRGAFFGVCFGDEHIRVAVLSSVREFFEEAQEMGHCVFSNRYYDESHHPYSLILSARDEKGRRLETVEVDMRRWEVAQSRGFQNNPTDRHDEIVAIVNKNMDVLKKIAV